MRTAMLGLLALIATACVDPHGERAATAVACDIVSERVGEWIKVDIAVNCSEGDWILEYRLLSNETVTITEREHPCGTLNRVSVLATPSLGSSLRITGSLYNSRRRIECGVSADR